MIDPSYLEISVRPIPAGRFIGVHRRVRLGAGADERHRVAFLGNRGRQLPTAALPNGDDNLLSTRRLVTTATSVHTIDLNFAGQRDASLMAADGLA